MKVLMVAPNISRKMGGEAVLPWHYIRELRKLGLDVHALTHARVREELSASPLWDADRTHFVEDSAAEKLLWSFGKRLPGPIVESGINPAISMVSMARLGGAARRIARDIGADILHQPTPVSPRIPSFLTGLSAPVVIGPLNGDMSFPPGFAAEYSRGSGMMTRAGRAFSGVGNVLFRGKGEAALILAANERTRRSLPNGSAPSEILVDNGVEVDLWRRPEVTDRGPPHFVFVGRLIWLKAVDLLIEAFGAVDARARLTIIGDGEERTRLQSLAEDSLAASRIDFAGWRKQEEIAEMLSRATALVLPSLRECGGAVILESFAAGTPAIAADWGGPAEYVSPETGILVGPTDRSAFVSGLASAMNALCADPARVRAMGEAARTHAVRHYSWSAKARTMRDIYERVAANAPKSRLA